MKHSSMATLHCAQLEDSLQERRAIVDIHCRFDLKNDDSIVFQIKPASTLLHNV